MKRKKRQRVRISIIVLITLIPVFFGGLMLAKSYSAVGKDIKEVVRDKGTISGNKGIEQMHIKKKLIPKTIAQDAKEKEEEPEEQEKSEEKVVYLTFDDGPSKQTNELLDILLEHDVKATFFMQGANLQQEELQASVKRTAQEGHYIGAHSMTHDFDQLYTEQQFVPEMNEALALIHEITGTNPNLVRPPYGSSPGLTSEHMRNEIADAGIKVWDWTIDSMDWMLTGNPVQIIENIKQDTNEPTEVVLMHEKSQTVAALPEIIEFYKAAGYTFGVYNEAHHFELNFLNDVRL